MPFQDLIFAADKKIHLFRFAMRLLDLVRPKQICLLLPLILSISFPLSFPLYEIYSQLSPPPPTNLPESENRENGIFFAASVLIAFLFPFLAWETGCCNEEEEEDTACVCPRAKKGGRGGGEVLMPPRIGRRAGSGAQALPKVRN